MLFCLNQSPHSKGRGYSAEPHGGCVLTLGTGTRWAGGSLQRKAGLSLPKKAGRTLDRAAEWLSAPGGWHRHSVNVSADPTTVTQRGQSTSSKTTFTGGIRGNRKAKDRPERALQATHTRSGTLERALGLLTGVGVRARRPGRGIHPVAHEH